MKLERFESRGVISACVSMSTCFHATGAASLGAPSLRHASYEPSLGNSRIAMARNPGLSFWFCSSTWMVATWPENFHAESISPKPAGGVAPVGTVTSIWVGAGVTASGTRPAANAAAAVSNRKIIGGPWKRWRLICWWKTGSLEAREPCELVLRGFGIERQVQAVFHHRLLAFAG